MQKKVSSGKRRTKYYPALVFVAPDTILTKTAYDILRREAPCSHTNNTNITFTPH